MLNSAHLVDFYKTGHAPQYPQGTEYVYSNLTPRSTKYAQTERITVFGIQATIINRLIKGFNSSFFKLPKEVAVRKYQRLVDNALGRGTVCAGNLADLHDLGYLPVHIKALPEGVQVLPKIPVMTIINTIPEFFWVTNYLETLLSGDLWLPMTSASIAREYRNILEKYAEITGTPKEFVAFQGHDFSMRGMYPEAAIASGAGHLLSFVGTDTAPSIDFLEDYYFANSDKELIGCSVPATEHSVMCMGGHDTEIDTFKRLLKLYPAGIVSIVSDTWDFWKVMTELAPALKEEIRARKPILADFDKEYELFEPCEFDYFASITDYVYSLACNGEHFMKYHYEPTSNTMYEAKITGEDLRVEVVEVCRPTVVVPGKTVFRPDSGDPVKILTGYKFNKENHYVSEKQVYMCLDNTDALPEVVKVRDNFYELNQSIDGRVHLGKELTEAEVKGAVEVLWDTFGGTITATGHKQLREVGLIYGDSITLERAYQILSRLAEKGFASGNVVLGIGSFTYQYNTRDTYGFAVKATWGQVNGEGRNIFKDPKTDDGTKKSATGLLRVELEDGEYVLYDKQTAEQESQGELRTVFKDGKLRNQQTLQQIRERVLNG